MKYMQRIMSTLLFVALCGCTCPSADQDAQAIVQDGIHLDLRQKDEDIVVRVSNEGNSPALVDGLLSITEPSLDPHVVLSISKNGRELTACTSFFPAMDLPPTVSLDTTSSIEITRSIQEIVAVYCIERGAYDVTAFYTADHKRHSRSNVLRVTVREGKREMNERLKLSMQKHRNE